MKPLRIGFFGAAPDTSNMGVSALCHSFLAAMAARLPDCEVVVFDNGMGQREADYTTPTGSIRVIRCGARGGNRYYRPENLATMAALARYPFSAQWHSGLALIDSCDVIMDVSGGDSFSDIYGSKRFRNIVLPKRIAVQRGKPLLLLPQTYGPYHSAAYEAEARAALLGAGQAWARDAGSFAVLQRLAGPQFNPDRHRCGVDMAFGLPAQAPASDSNPIPQTWQDSNAPLLGFNISGLVWHAQNNEFGFKADYASLVTSFLQWVLAETDANILIVPHVQAASGTAESDADASADASARILDGSTHHGRVQTVPEGLDEGSLKWVISRCDWFCGTRMHATIAGLSSGVPTASIVYSDKAQGVFDSCGQGREAIDPRALDTAAALAQLQRSFLARNELRQSLRTGLERVNQVLGQQMDDIAQFAVESAVARPAVAS